MCNLFAVIADEANACAVRDDAYDDAFMLKQCYINVRIM